MKRILTISLLTLIIGGIIGYYLYSINTRIEPIQRHQTTTTQSSNNKRTAKQLLTERAESLYGRSAHVEVDSGYYGGAYQVTIWTDYHNYVYVAEVDEPNQKITAWELKSSN